MISKSVKDRPLRLVAASGGEAAQDFVRVVRAHGRGKVLSLFPNWPVRRPNRTRYRGRIHRGRIGVFGRGLPRQARELTTSAATKGDWPLAGPGGAYITGQVIHVNGGLYV